MAWGSGGYSVKILPLHSAVNDFSSHYYRYSEVQCNDWFCRRFPYRNITFTSYLLSPYTMSLSTFFCIPHSSSQTTKNHAVCCRDFLKVIVYLLWKKLHCRSYVELVFKAAVVFSLQFVLAVMTNHCTIGKIYKGSEHC